jgi:SAM-dependent methyltransferase
MAETHCFHHDSAVQVYESLVDWPKRLANEGSFFRRQFDEAGVRSVLDAACGTGHHAAMFHGWGLSVEGADISPAMIEHCRNRWGSSGRLQWAVRSFDSQPHQARRFDAVVCLGNSLALVGDARAARAALAAMFGWVSPGGVLVAQVVNLWRLPDGPTQWKCVRPASGEESRVFLKGMHRSGSTGYVDLIDVSLGKGAKVNIETPAFIGLEAADLAATLESNGATAIRAFGGYDESPHVRTSSADILVTCQRPTG